MSYDLELIADQYEELQVMLHEEAIDNINWLFAEAFESQN